MRKAVPYCSLNLLEFLQFPNSLPEILHENKIVYSVVLKVRVIASQIENECERNWWLGILISHGSVTQGVIVSLSGQITKIVPF